MKRLALLVLVLAAVGVPSTAHAAVPCRDKIYNDWYANGKIDTNYPIACYKDALAHIPADAQIYSNLTADIHAAMQGAIARAHGKTVPAQIGKGVSATGKKVAGQPVNLSSTTPATSGTPTTTALAADATSSGSSGLPVPILVLGALAILLAAAGAAGAGIRHYRNRV
jgi:hypothetical protein